MKYYIYTLTDPITNKVRYVGKTTNLKKRYYYHCSLFCNNLEKTHRSNWIKSLLNKNLKPIMNEIDKCSDNWQEKEIYWIKYYKDLGYDLCNHTSGGEGGLGFSQYKEFIIYQFDKEGNFIRDWKSTLEASNTLNIPFESIKKCIRGLYKTAGNYHWSKDKSFSPKSRNHNAKIVLQYDLNNNFINKYNSITQASVLNNIQRNSIKNCCMNKQKTAGKFKWKYE